MHQAAAGDLEFFRRLSRFDAEGDIGLSSLSRRSLIWTAGDVFALRVRQATVIDAEGHVHCRFINGDDRQCAGLIGTGDGVADIDRVQSGDGADVTGLNQLGGFFAQPVKRIELDDFLLGVAALVVDDGDALSLLDGSGKDAPDGDAAEVVRAIQRRNEHLSGWSGSSWGAGT